MTSFKQILENLTEGGKKNYYAPTESEKSITRSEIRKFQKKYPDAKVSTKDGIVRVNGKYAYSMTSEIGNDKGDDRFDKMVQAYNDSKTIKKEE